MKSKIVSLLIVFLLVVFPCQNVTAENGVNTLTKEMEVWLKNHERDEEELLAAIDEFNDNNFSTGEL